MTILGRINIRPWLITILVVLFAVSGSRSASATEIISASLVADHFQWPGNEIIVGGYLRLQGGTFESHDSADDMHSTIKGPLWSQIKTDPRAGDTALLFGMETLTGNGPVDWYKKMQPIWVSDWFDIEVPRSTHRLICPSKNCPIEIEGELEFSDPLSDAHSKKEPRRVRVTTSD